MREGEGTGADTECPDPASTPVPCLDPCADPILAATLQAATSPDSTPEQKAAVLQTAGKREASVLQTAGQRRINMIWEITQAMIAVLVTGTTLGVCAYMVVSNPSEDNGAFMFLSNIFFLVIGTYFQRTNHVKMGGVPGPRGEER